MRKIRYKEASKSLENMSVPDFLNNSRASIGMDKFAQEFYFIDTSKLIPYKNQARVIFDEDELQNLATTIKEHGVRQPLTIVKSKIEEGKFEVVSGERRLRASKLAGLDKVPCIIIEDADNIEEIALIENVQRKDLHPMELAYGLKSLIDKFGWGGQLELAKRLGMSQSRISRCLNLLKLPPNIQQLIIKENYVGRDNLEALLKIEDPELLKQKILGDKGNIKSKISVVSVLRMSFNAGELKVQNGAFKNLTISQKELVREKLLQLVAELK
ncbi:ParB/RepB/Spo0J family partition protein [Candidatus Paracaedibacter symbiosus]|uniref:ParB/RepB/Spo0J family partition protein n=1 Tax=Candidatus Paracaedibacter symbiosus TaxID=244582 RepID=UPI00068D2461|nr:ParB/RepB/Spo0J family partition protein [Candidatus Paracaedibacter symbiosus]